MTIPFIIRMDAISQDTLVCDENGISLQKTPPAPLFINCINICENKNEVDLDHREESFTSNETSLNVPQRH